MEIWKPLIYGDLDLSNRYEVSNTGKIRNIKTKHELKQQLHPTGYKVLCISLGSRTKKKLIKMHKAVAYMFVDGYSEGLEVNHKDFDRANNYYTNLEWVTGEFNMEYSIKNSPKWKGKTVKVRCKQTGEVFNTINDAAKWCGLKDGSNIGLVLRGIYKYSGNHPITKERLSWEYA